MAVVLIETSPLLCKANPLICFPIMATLALMGMKEFVVENK